MSGHEDGDWVFSEVGRTYPTAEDYRRGITGGYTLHMQMMWVPKETTYCFWLGKDGLEAGGPDAGLPERSDAQMSPP